jgi:hypothetical protein
MPDTLINIPEPGKIVQDVKDAVGKSIGKDLTAIQGFSQSFLDKIGAHAKGLGKEILDGTYKDIPDVRDHFLEGLAKMVRLFLKALIGLAAVLIQNAWNAMVGVIWKIFDEAAGGFIPRPSWAPKP